MRLTDYNWQELTAELKKGNCCLLLGPEINCIPTNRETEITVHDHFTAFLREKISRETITLDSSINSFYYLANKYVTSKYPGKYYLFEKNEINEFNNLLKNESPSFYKKISLLPFKSILCTTPDNFLVNALQELGYEFAEEVYDYKGNGGEKPELQEEMQLVFNIFGTYNIPNSISYNERAHLEQIKKITNNTPVIWDNIRARFVNPQKTFIFLGFNFNDWYFRLIMDSLGIPNPIASYHPLLTSGYEVAILAKEFYSDNFGINFIEPDTFSFVSELIQRYETIYGKLDRTLLIVLDYCNEDKKYFEEINIQLKGSFSRRNVEIKSKNDLLLGEANNINELAAKADVYIPFISSSFLNDDESKVRLQRSLANVLQQTILIKANYVDFKRILRELKDKAIILPKNDQILSGLNDTELTKISFELARLINSIVR